MNAVTKYHLEEFSRQLGIIEQDETVLYELFAIYGILKSYYIDDVVEAMTVLDFNTGKGNDWGIDGFIITINGRLVTTIEDLELILSQKMEMNVRIGLIQAKTTAKFDNAEMDKLFNGVRNIIADLNKDVAVTLPPCNEKIKALRQILKKLFQNGNYFLDGQVPELNLFYVCEGKYEESGDHAATLSRITRDIIDSNLFRFDRPKMIGQSALIDLIKTLKYSRTASLEISKHVTLPKVDGIKQSHLCLVPFNEFRKLIIDEEGKLLGGLFENNVRDFQGNNPVNAAMRESIRKRDKSYFAVMNNGVTIIARELTTRGDIFDIKDYQIVNGCQTCNVLVQCMNEPDIDKVNIVLKLISSELNEISNMITVANNSQTEVKQEQLVSLLEMQKDIEDYYNAQTAYKRLYYERRSKQYRYGDNSVPQESVVSIGSQIRSYVSMFLSEPHNINGYYGSIVEDFSKKGTEVFDKDSKPCYYYTAAYAWNTLSSLISSGFITRPARAYGFHILLVFRILNELSGFSKNSAHAEKYCIHLCNILKDTDKSKAALSEAADVVRDTLKKYQGSDQRTISQSEEFTNDLIALSHKRKKAKEIGNETGTMSPSAVRLAQPKIIGKIDLAALSDHCRPKKRKR